MNEEIFSRNGLSSTGGKDTVSSDLKPTASKHKDKDMGSVLKTPLLKNRKILLITVFILFGVIISLSGHYVYKSIYGPNPESDEQNLSDNNDSLDDIKGVSDNNDSLDDIKGDSQESTDSDPDKDADGQVLVCNLTSTNNLRIKLLDAPTEVTMQISMFKSNSERDLDTDAVIYEFGTVEDGYLEGTDVTGYRYLIGDYYFYSEYLGAFMNKNIVRFVYKDADSKAFILADYGNVSYQVEHGIPGGGTDSFPLEDNFVNLSLDMADTTSRESEIKCFWSKEIDVFESEVAGHSPSYFYLTSSEDLQFVVLDENLLTVMDTFVAIDILADTKILFDELNNEYYAISLDGLATHIRIVSDMELRSFQGDFDKPTEFVFNDGTSNKYRYSSVDSSKYGSVYGGGDVSYYDIIDINEADLQEIGTSPNGYSIYEYIDSNDPYLTKLYNEDYIDHEAYLYNTITEDDVTPFTYEEYLSYHPVIFWGCPYGSFYRYTSSEFIVEGGIAKPAIYLYPKTDMNVTVRIEDINGSLSFTYPSYDNIWEVFARRTGIIHDYGSRMDCDYLWWESNPSTYVYPLNRGFVVRSDDAIMEIGKHLDTFGLNDKETDDFLEYWRPLVEKESSKYLYITYMFNEQVDYYAKLNVDPKPDTTMRVLMFYKPLEEYINVDELEIPQMERAGFVLVEWGGSKIY